MRADNSFKLGLTQASGGREPSMSSNASTLLATLVAMNFTREERNILKAFESYGALSAEGAIHPSRLPTPRFGTLRNLVQRGIVLTRDDGKMYINRDRRTEQNVLRLKAIWFVTCFAVVSAIATFLLMYFWAAA